MASFGYFLSCEEFHPNELVHQAVRAEAAGGAQLEGRFVLGLGTGEALNEHITGQHWPPAVIRRQMLEEAVDIIRKLFSGKQINHHGRYFTVENAQIYTLPPEPVPIYISGFGPGSAELAGKIGDGYQSTIDSPELLSAFREGGGEGKPTQAGFKVCHASTTEEAVSTAHELWANEHLPDELAQILPTPTHFEQTSSLVPKSAVEDAVPCGPDAKPYIDRIRAFVDAGYDEVYIQQIGPDQDRFFDF